MPLVFLKKLHGICRPLSVTLEIFLTELCFQNQTIWDYSITQWVIFSLSFQCFVIFTTETIYLFG